MSKILFITTSPVANGNGDTLIETAIEAAKNTGAETVRMDVRDMNIGSCKACNDCMERGSCVQQDDFDKVLSAVRECDSIIVTIPIYFNLPCSQAVTLLNRFFCLFSPKYKGSGKEKNLQL